MCRLVLPHSIGVYSNQKYFRKINKTINITNVIAEFHVKCFYLVTLELSNSTFVKNLLICPVLFTTKAEINISDYGRRCMMLIRKRNIASIVIIHPSFLIENTG